jgi:hypothetical protein
MAKKYRPVDRDQQFLLPVSMTDWLPDDRLGVVALDGTKIAANASIDANRTETGLRQLAEQHLAAAAATDAAEDALFGDAPQHRRS